jgi:hypothetical protein
VANVSYVRSSTHAISILVSIVSALVDQDS